MYLFIPVDLSPELRPRLLSTRTAILPPSRSYAFDVLPLNQNKNRPQTLPYQPHLIPLISRSRNTFKLG